MSSLHNLMQIHRFMKHRRRPDQAYYDLLELPVEYPESILAHINQIYDQHPDLEDFMSSSDEDTDSGYQGDDQDNDEQDDQQQDDQQDQQDEQDDQPQDDQQDQQDDQQQDDQQDQQDDQDADYQADDQYSQDDQDDQQDEDDQQEDEDDQQEDEDDQQEDEDDEQDDEDASPDFLASARTADGSIDTSLLQVSQALILLEFFEQLLLSNDDELYWNELLQIDLEANYSRFTTLLLSIANHFQLEKLPRFRPTSDMEELARQYQTLTHFAAIFPHTPIGQEAQHLSTQTPGEAAPAINRLYRWLTQMSKEVRKEQYEAPPPYGEQIGAGLPPTIPPPSRITAEELASAIISQYQLKYATSPPSPAAQAQVTKGALLLLQHLARQNLNPQDYLDTHFAALIWNTPPAPIHPDLVGCHCVELIRQALPPPAAAPAPPPLADPVE